MAKFALVWVSDRKINVILCPIISLPWYWIFKSDFCCRFEWPLCSHWALPEHDLPTTNRAANKNSEKHLEPNVWWIFWIVRFFWNNVGYTWSNSLENNGSFCRYLIVSEIFFFSCVSVSQCQADSACILFTVMDHDFMVANDFAGEAYLSLNSISGVNGEEVSGFSALTPVTLVLTQPRRSTGRICV